MQNPAHTTLRRTRSTALFTSAVATAFAAVPQVASAGVVAPDSGASPTGDSINVLYLIVAVLGVLALLAVVASIVSAVRSPGAEGSDAGSSSAKPAVIGSVVVALALAVLGGLTLSGASTADQSASGTPTNLKVTPLQDPNLKVGHQVDLPKGPAIGVQVNGQQYLWRYTYLGKSVYSYHDLVIPVGVTVVLYVTSSDVEHNWWVPQLGSSIQAIPGYVNMGWIRADKAGTYNGASTVISGTNYQNMTTRVVAKSIADFDSWIENKTTELKDSATDLAAQKAAAEGEAK
ncbi:MAG: cytochrome c oxidase subunit II [Actinobacteria bacterium]|nr:cytochrome c oxidase subunit II [Actinomycetota bacterium]